MNYEINNSIPKAKFIRLKSYITNQIRQIKRTNIIYENDTEINFIEKADFIINCNKICSKIKKKVYQLQILL